MFYSLPPYGDKVTRDWPPYASLTALYQKSDNVFPEMKMRGLVPNSYIHVSVSTLYIPTISPPIFLQQNMQTDGGNIKIAHRNMNIE